MITQITSTTRSANINPGRPDRPNVNQTKKKRVKDRRKATGRREINDDEVITLIPITSSTLEKTSTNNNDYIKSSKKGTKNKFTSHKATQLRNFSQTQLDKIIIVIINYYGYVSLISVNCYK